MNNKVDILNEIVSDGPTIKVETTNVSSDSDTKKVDTKRSRSFNSTIKVSREFAENRRRTIALLDTSSLIDGTKSINSMSNISHDSLYDKFTIRYLDIIYSLLVSLITIHSSLKTYRQQLPQHKLAAFDNSWSRLFNSNSNNYFDIKSELLFQELKSVAEVHSLNTTLHFYCKQ